jgi:hypothetical protein
MNQQGINGVMNHIIAMHPLNCPNMMKNTPGFEHCCFITVGNIQGWCDQLDKVRRRDGYFHPDLSYTHCLRFIEGESK